MNRRATTLACYAVVVVIAIGILSYVGMWRIQAMELRTTKDIEGDVQSIAFETGSRMSAVASIMQVTANLPQVRDTSDVHLMSEENKGVPEDSAIGKRQVAKDILASNPDIDAIGFILSNGDMYLEEPYSRQLNLTRTNFVTRDYFQGAVTTDNPYLGEVYISAATGSSATALAVPVYNGDRTLAGVWMAIMNLQAFNSRANELLGSDYGGRVVYIDQNNHEVVSSSALVSADEALSGLQSYADALAGNSGSRAEMHDGVQMFVAYSPIKMPGATWVIIAMQPYSEVFSRLPMMQLQGAIVVTSVIAAGIGFVIYRIQKT
ncbi:MAG: cache domain-containing protein [Thermoproteota archaeon]